MDISVRWAGMLMPPAWHRHRSRARQALARAEEDASRIEAILSTAADAILSINEQGIVERANAATERLFGHRPEDLVGSSAFVLIPVSAGQRFEGRLSEYYSEAGEEFVGRSRETVCRRKDGSRFPVEVLTTRRSIGGRVLFTAIVRDISERQAVRDELTRRELELSERSEALARCTAELQEFAHLVACDLAEPLAAVAGYVQLLEADHGDRLDEQARAYLRLASNETRRMRQLIDDLPARATGPGIPVS